MKKNNFILNGRKISATQPPYVVAEMSGNHNGDIGRAFAILEAAKDAGADAVKMQTYTADTITINHSGPDFIIQGGLWDKSSLYNLYEKAHTPWDWHAPLFQKAHDIGITVFSAPFDKSAVDFLENLNSPAYKIASFEIVDLPLITKAAATGKPLILSTGMATLLEIDEAINTARAAGARDILVLHCVSGYPTPAKDCNLATIRDLASRFNVFSGLSDHTLGIAVPIAAIGYGAVLVEKHITLSRKDGGPDANFSIEPEELKMLVDGIRTAWEAGGHPNYNIAESERNNAMFRRSLYVIEDIPKGNHLTETNIRSIRPGHGIAPKYLPDVLGPIARRDLKRGEALTWEMFRSK